MSDGTQAGPMIEAEGLVKHYGKTRALTGVGFAMPAGEGPRPARPERRREPCYGN